MKRFVKKPRRTPTKKTQTKQTPPPLLPLPVLLLTEQHALDQRLRAQVLPLDDPQQHQTISCEPEHERRDGGAGDGKEQHRAYVGEEAPLLQGHSCREDDGREQAVEKSRGREAQGGCEAGEPDDDARGGGSHAIRCLWTKKVATTVEMSRSQTRRSSTYGGGCSGG